MINWLIENKEWVFSGIGIVILGLFKPFIQKRNNALQNKDLLIHKPVKVEENIIFPADNLEKITNEQSIISKEINIVDSPINELANKFYQILEDHGVRRTQIPSFIDKKFNIQLKDVENIESIIPKLNDELLDWVSHKFSIKRSWFDTNENDTWQNRLYDSLDVYKNHWSFLNLIEKLIDETDPYKYKDFLKIYFLKNFKEFNGDDSEAYAMVSIIIEVSNGKTSTDTVHKYILIRNNLRWDYWKSRWDLKRIIRITEKLDIYNVGYELSKEEFEKINSEEIVPKIILKKLKTVNWYPYDFDGSKNDRINSSEYEKSSNFYKSLQIIDKECILMLDKKRVEFKNKYL